MSKVQIIVGILQIFVTWTTVRYVWAIGWAVLPFFMSKPGQEAPLKQAAYDAGIAKLNPFEKLGGM